MTENKIQSENKMGVLPINKLLLTISLPIVISMLVQALYNIVDSVFVARINENALTALSLSFPIQNLMIAVSVGTGVGVNALLARSLGEKNFDTANKTATNGIFITFLSSLLFVIFGLFFSRKYFEMQTNDLQIIEYGTTYLSICTIYSAGIFLEIILERLLQATGKTLYTMVSQGIGAVTNIILDPILIFGLLGFPKLGVAGAAWATVIGQFVSMFIALYFNIYKNNEIKLNIKKFKPDLTIIKSIYSVALPSIVMSSLGSVMTYGLNKILLQFSTTAAAVLGVYFKLQSFIFMPVFGLTNGMVPIIAYNYGARKKQRIIETIKLSAIVATAIMVIGFLAFQFFPQDLLHIFKASEEMIATGVPALRIISFHFLLAGFSIVLVSVYQAFGNGFLSLMVSFSRQIIFLLPIAFIFAKLFNRDAVWLAFPIAEVASIIINIIFLKYLYRTKLQNLDRNTLESDSETVKAAEL